MPNLSAEGLVKVEPRWPDNEYKIEAPPGICGDYKCGCADEARFVLSDREYRLAFGVPKHFGLNDDCDWIPGYSTVVTVPGGWVGIHARDGD